MKNENRLHLLPFLQQVPYTAMLVTKIFTKLYNASQYFFTTSSTIFIGQFCARLVPKGHDNNFTRFCPSVQSLTLDSIPKVGKSKNCVVSFISRDTVWLALDFILH